MKNWEFFLLQIRQVLLQNLQIGEDFTNYGDKLK